MVDQTVLKFSTSSERHFLFNYHTLVPPR